MKALIKDHYIQPGGFGVLKKNEKNLYKSNKIHISSAYFEKGDNIINFTNKIIACKIDVEGHELNVLNGMINILKKNKLILQIEIFNSEYKKVNSFLKKNNYHQINKIFSDGKNDYYFKNF